MLLTKFGHSCVRLEKDGARLVIDPGIWAGPDVLAEASAVLVTHEHVDHVDDEAVRAALTADTDLRLWASETVASQFAEFAGRVQAVHHGDTFDAAGFDVHVYGSEHAAGRPDHPDRAEHRLRDRRRDLPPGRLVHRARGQDPDAAASPSARRG